ncbi:hypothetical protein OTERR_22520 [Oryzomicrobium terrae]|uniref:DUF192 domain-containing protein n=1 Tax=Oryzomicrobium terrae TaxID=1735038 RepID=A0A5C1EBV1_9RHOO|nr:hypothetical protein OTERR_22520 [Oryzomicrobium terrae]
MLNTVPSLSFLSRWRQALPRLSRTWLAALPAAIVVTGPAAEEFPRMELAAGIHRIEAEVAATQETREKGLMYRTALAPNQGMLFVFPQAARHCMWMRNTLLPLSVAFIDGQGRIINVAEMQPRTENNHCSAEPARFALEMNSGWFSSRGLKSGMSIQGIERAPAPR